MPEKAAAAVAGHAAVGVDDDLAPGEPGVGVRAAEDELARRVHVEAHRARVEVARQHRADHVLDHVALDRRVVVAIFVLGGDEHRVDADGSTVLVGDRHLGLAVGPQVGHLPGAAHLAQAHREAVGQPDRQRHEVVVVVAGVAEHHALVARAERVELVFAACAVAVLERDVNSTGDVGALLVQRDQHRAGASVKALGAVVVADVEDRAPRDRRDVNDGARGDLAGDDAQAGREQRLARHARERVLGEDGVEHAVRDLVGDLVGVPFGHRLRGEESAIAHGSPCGNNEPP